jgi:hypothetical protein
LRISHPIENKIRVDIMKVKNGISSAASLIAKNWAKSKQEPKYILEYMKRLGDGSFEVCTDCADKTLTNLDSKNTLDALHK